MQNKLFLVFFLCFSILAQDEIVLAKKVVDYKSYLNNLGEVSVSTDKKFHKNFFNNVKKNLGELKYIEFTEKYIRQSLNRSVGLFRNDKYFTNTYFATSQGFSIVAGSGLDAFFDGGKLIGADFHGTKIRSLARMVLEHKNDAYNTLIAESVINKLIKAGKPYHAINLLKELAGSTDNLILIEEVLSKNLKNLIVNDLETVLEKLTTGLPKEKVELVLKSVSINLAHQKKEELIKVFRERNIDLCSPHLVK